MIRAPRRMLTFHGEFYDVQDDMAEQLSAHGLGSPGTWQSATEGDVVSAAATSVCRRLTLKKQGEQAPEDEQIYIKLANYSPKRCLRTWWQPAKTTVEAFAYGKLRELGIPTLRTLALAERRTFGFLRASLIVTQGVPNSIDLLHFMQQEWPLLSGVARKNVLRQVGEQLVEQLRRAHAVGFVHHDLKWRNVLLAKQDERWMSLWIDSPRAAIWPAFRRDRARLIDLADLARMSASELSLYERARFLRNYLGPERRPGELKSWFQRIDARVKRRQARDARRTRRLAEPTRDPAQENARENV